MPLAARPFYQIFSRRVLGGIGSSLFSRKKSKKAVHQSLLEHSECWLCHAPLADVYWNKPDCDSPYNGRYMRCASCGLVVASPVQKDRGFGLTADGHINYVNDIELYASSVSIEAQAYLWRRLEHERAQHGMTATGKLLEIGCAAGYLLSTARARGWNVMGIEPSATMAAWAKKFQQLNVENGFFEEIELEDGHFDAIVAVEVLEHVLDPQQFVQRVFQKLAPGGWMLVTTPNVYSGRFFPPEPTTAILDPVDHLNLFCKPTLIRLLREAGFENVNVEEVGEQGWHMYAFASKAAVPSVASDAA